MNKEFKDRIDSLPKLQNELMNSIKRYRDDLQDIPKSGVYVFYENEKPIFVGRSDHMRKRIMTQGRQGSNHNSAPFAFSLAKEAAIEKEMDVQNKTRNELENNPEFNHLFLQAKNRVSKMAIRYISIEDPILQTLFQIYLSMELKTPYNDFKTH
ncbi:hypothetical protein [Methanococcoides sp. NM1]|uniref:hypothetical protein n=1 Tax=Methanococcoides sp. NM1 TaxID=1201013 RepID=UPI001083F447|nr:hypothetical protein [Methanococcoides sp. NM1]